VKIIKIKSLKIEKIDLKIKPRVPIKYYIFLKKLRPKAFLK
jgi:hypothetical protein